jgi:hypothetical protein
MPTNSTYGVVFPSGEGYVLTSIIELPEINNKTLFLFTYSASELK